MLHLVYIISMGLTERNVPAQISVLKEFKSLFTKKLTQANILDITIIQAEIHSYLVVRTL